MCRHLSASSIYREETLHSLWGDQGKLIRVHSNSSRYPSAILKRIRFNPAANHPRGWNTTTSYQRKVRSYGIEYYWYQHYAHHCGAQCKVPQTVGLEHREHDYWMLLEDLGIAYPQLSQGASLRKVKTCLAWLANFHARFMGHAGEGLWPIGTYWHLSTRPDEYQAMPDSALKAAAFTIDETLNKTTYLTLVHGDAKVANFCFAADYDRAAAVDFQYVGCGCGMKDVVYLFSSCLTEQQWQSNEDHLLEHYFQQLLAALPETFSITDKQKLKEQWTHLYPVAWADFVRFLVGWSPGHAKLTSYAKQLSNRGISAL